MILEHFFGEMVIIHSCGTVFGHCHSAGLAEDVMIVEMTVRPIVDIGFILDKVVSTNVVMDNLLQQLFH